MMRQVQECVAQNLVARLVEDDLAVLLKLIAPAKSGGRKRPRDPAAAVAAFNTAIEARKR